MKFGGSLAADARSIRRVAQIIQAEALAWQQMVVVVSAMAGATDALAQAVELAAVRDGAAYRAQIAVLRAQHVAVIDSLFPTQNIRSGILQTLDQWLFDALGLCDMVAAHREATPRDRDAIMSIGERLMADILIVLLQREGLRSALVDSAQWMITDDHYQNASPQIDLVEERVERVIRPLLKAGMVTLVCGFIGTTRGGAMTTLGRGGSDYTATILAAALHADEVWMWTSVDGIMSADPSLVPNARVIDLLSYDEIRELSYFGVRVLHPRAVEPLLPGAIPMRVRNPFRVDHAGTLIMAHPSHDGLKAVSAIDGLLVSTPQPGIDLPGFLAQVNHSVGQAAMGPVLVTQSQAGSTLVFVVPTTEGPAAATNAAQRLTASFPASRWAVRVVKVIAAMGALHMEPMPGIVPLAFGHGAADRYLLVVAPGDVQAAVRLMHRLT